METTGGNKGGEKSGSGTGKLPENRSQGPESKGVENTAGQESTWRERERKEEEWDNFGMGMENSIGNGREFGMAVDNERKHEGSESKTHVEDWENDPFKSRLGQQDVRSELNLRKSSQEDERGENTGEWDGTGSHTGRHNSENGSRESGTDETVGIP